MLALAAAAHGPYLTEILTILAAITAAIFWRALLKIALGFFIILFAMLLFGGAPVLIHDLHLIFP